MINEIISIPFRDIFIHKGDMSQNEKLESGKQTRLRPTSARQEAEITMKSKAEKTGKRRKKEGYRPLLRTQIGLAVSLFRRKNQTFPPFSTGSRPLQNTFIVVVSGLVPRQIRPQTMRFRPQAGGYIF